MIYNSRKFVIRVNDEGAIDPEENLMRANLRTPTISCVRELKHLGHNQRYSGSSEQYLQWQPSQGKSIFVIVCNLFSLNNKLYFIYSANNLFSLLIIGIFL